MSKRATLLLIPVLIFSSLFTVGSAFAQSITKPSVPEFTLKYADYSYNVPPIYEINQYTGENVTLRDGYHVENRTIECTFKNQPFAPYTDSSGNNIQLYYNFRYKGNYGEEWTYYPYNSKGWTVIHYGWGTYEMYPPFYPASNSDYTVVSLSLILLGPPVGSQEIPDDTEVNFQTQALIGYFDINKNGYYILTGESSDWSNIQTITIPESQTLPPLPTIPTSPTQMPDEEPELSEQEIILGAVIATAVIGAGLGLLIYLIKRK